MISLKLPIKTISEANATGEHWSKKHKRHSAQRRAILYSFMPLRDKIALPCKIKFIRIAPRKLDIGDNLPMSMKTVRDQLAEIITGEEKAGRGDGDPRLHFEYSQEKGLPREYAIRIEIT